MNILRYRFSLVNYTLQHMNAFRRVEKQLFGKVSLRGYLHDLDKVFLYPILGKKLTHNLHKNLSRHHKRARTVRDFQQMVVDWECARFTKPDKPLDAYDTLYALYPNLEDKILPILKELNLVHIEKG